MPGIRKTMDEFKAGKLHSGSKHGPEVKSRAQAIAIGLSEQRKEGHHVKQPKHPHKNMEMKGSNLPFGAATHGKPNEHDIHQGHKMAGPAARKNDGAGRHGADESGMYRSYSEHKAPTHPDGGTAHYNNEAGAFGYPGRQLQIDHEHQLVGGNYSQTMHEPAVLKTPDGQGFTAGHPGIHAGMGGAKPSGYGHQQSQRDGVHRLSGHPGAHRVGRRK